MAKPHDLRHKHDAKREAKRRLLRHRASLAIELCIQSERSIDEALSPTRHPDRHGTPFADLFIGDTSEVIRSIHQLDHGVTVGSPPLPPLPLIVMQMIYAARQNALPTCVIGGGHASAPLTH